MPTKPNTFVLLAAWCLAAGIVLVPVLFGIAMACFPPGYAGANEGYSFSRHVVSDLGRTHLDNGRPNTLSCGLFALAMILSGAVSALFWIARQLFVRHPLARRSVLVCGLFTSVCLAAIGLTPLDRAAPIHDPITAATAVGAALAILALSADPDTRLQSRYSKRLWLAALMLVTAIWTVLVALHHEHLLAFRPWLPLGQKTLICTFISWLVYQNALLFKSQRTQLA